MKKIFFSCVAYLYFQRYALFEEIRIKSCQQAVSKSIKARVLEFYMLIGDDVLITS